MSRVTVQPHGLSLQAAVRAPPSPLRLSPGLRPPWTPTNVRGSFKKLSSLAQFEPSSYSRQDSN